MSELKAVEIQELDGEKSRYYLPLFRVYSFGITEAGKFWLASEISDSPWNEIDEESYDRLCRHFGVVKCKN